MTQFCFLKSYDIGIYGFFFRINISRQNHRDHKRWNLEINYHQINSCYELRSCHQMKMVIKIIKSSRAKKISNIIATKWYDIVMPNVVTLKIVEPKLFRICPFPLRMGTLFNHIWVIFPLLDEYLLIWGKSEVVFTPFPFLKKLRSPLFL